MNKLLLHTISVHFSPNSVSAGVKPLLAAGALDLETGAFKFFLPDDAREIPGLVLNASLLVTFNGKSNAFPILRKYYGLKGSTAKIPPRGRHIELQKEILAKGSRPSLLLDEAIAENLVGEVRLATQGQLTKLKGEDLYRACKSDIEQLCKLYQLHQSGNLRCPPAKTREGVVRGKTLKQLEREARLTVELVPATAWCSNVRTAVRPKDWDIIRRATYEKSDYRCEICGGIGKRHPVECHEIWEYAESDRIQRLIGFTALCPRCHEVKHVGRANAIGRGEDAARHLAEVNQWTMQEAYRYIQNAQIKWLERSAFQWHLDLRLLDQLGIPYDKPGESETGA